MHDVLTARAGLRDTLRGVLEFGDVRAVLIEGWRGRACMLRVGGVQQRDDHIYVQNDFSHS
jgi:hypothetical protein